MIGQNQLRGHARIRLIQGQQVAEGALEYSPEESAMMLVLPDKNFFGGQPGGRIKLDFRLLAQIELLPDGTLQLNWAPAAGNPGLKLSPGSAALPPPPV